VGGSADPTVLSTSHMTRKAGAARAKEIRLAHHQPPMSKKSPDAIAVAMPMTAAMRTNAT